MSAAALSKVQFRKETTDSDKDKHAAEGDEKGRDENEAFGFSGTDPSDYQYERFGKAETDTHPKREVF